MNGGPAPAWEATRWFNSAPLTVAGLRGQVVVLEAFQMLCPGCVSHGLPQVGRLARTFGDEVAIVGLHTVFEHHEAMTPTSLEAFLHEYRIGFPVGVDAHDGLSPVTFTRYRMRGTPSTVLIDRAGAIRGHYFGAVDDMTIAAAVARLIDVPVERHEPTETPYSACTLDGACT